MHNIQEIKTALNESNKWWKREFSVEFKNRKVYSKLREFLGKRQIIAITGLRRVGKTTIMHKIVEENLSKYPKENVIYFSFDDLREAKIREILDVYCDLFGKNLENEKYLILLDEIQKLENWEEQIKRFYDNYTNIKFIISGSESLFIKKKSRESLAGRFYEFEVKPLDFEEFLLFKEKEIGKNVELYEREILNLFKQYLQTNGFPEIINEDSETIKKYLKENIIEKIVYKDIPEIFDVKDIDLLAKLVRIIMYEPGQIIEINKLAGELSVSRQTLSLYLDYLESAHLIKKLYNFSRNIRKTERKSKKFYSAIIYPELINEEKISKIFENFLVFQFEAEFFYRDPLKNEVDIIKVNEFGKKIVPIEIKYGKIEIDGIRKFMEKFNLTKGYVVSYREKRDVKIDKGIIHVLPFYYFLLKKIF